MKKLFLTSTLIAFVSCPALATVDIVADAETANCNNTVLHTYDSPTSLEADWSANTITLNWYNDNTKITPSNNTANSCTYDGAITLPSSNPTKTGYTFAGWQVRVASQGGQQNEPSTPQQTSFDLSTLDPSISATDYGYDAGYDEEGRINADTYGLTTNEWAMEFSYGTVKGVSKAEYSNYHECYEDPEDPDATYCEDGTNVNCYCKVTGFDAEKDGTYLDVASSSWVYASVWPEGEFQDRYCLEECASRAMDNGESNPSGYLSQLYGISQ